MCASISSLNVLCSPSHIPSLMSIAWTLFLLILLSFPLPLFAELAAIAAFIASFVCWPGGKDSLTLGLWAQLTRRCRSALTITRYHYGLYTVYAACFRVELIAKLYLGYITCDRFLHVLSHVTCPGGLGVEVWELVFGTETRWRRGWGLRWSCWMLVDTHFPMVKVQGRHPINVQGGQRRRTLLNPKVDPRHIRA